MKSGWNDKDEEELPANIVESNWSGDKKDDISQVQTTHAEGRTLASNMSWEDFGTNKDVSRYRTNKNSDLHV